MKNLRHCSGLTLPAAILCAFVAISVAAVPCRAETDAPATLEVIEGSPPKRLVLTSATASRLAIETKAVREERVQRWLMVEGEIEAVEPSPDKTAGAIVAASHNPLRVRIPLLKDETKFGRVIVGLSVGGGSADGDDVDDEPGDGDDPGDVSDQGENEIPAVLVLPIGSEYGKVWFQAKPIDLAPDADAEATYYTVGSTGDNILRPGQRVVVRLTQPGSRLPQKVVPYSAILYDTSGDSWVYISPQPLVFVRHAVTVEYVERDVAVLTDGPAVGTKVVTVGAAELMGIELKIGH
jgi:hypothetical protein